LKCNECAWVDTRIETAKYPSGFVDGTTKLPRLVGEFKAPPGPQLVAANASTVMDVLPKLSHDRRRRPGRR
jgi:hypothetical protein